MGPAHSATVGRIRDLISHKLPPLDRFRLEKVQDRLVDVPRCGILSSFFATASLLPLTVSDINDFVDIIFFWSVHVFEKIGKWVMK